VLLFGPSGTGKTMIVKAIASECKCAFLNISCSSLISKVLGGYSDKFIHTLFELTYEKQPSIVFFDNIDLIFSNLSINENSNLLKLKTELIVQLDRIIGNNDISKKIVVIGSTNKPFELDFEILRILSKRIYLGPFDKDERSLFLKETIKSNIIEDSEYGYISNITNNYSNGDLKKTMRKSCI